MSNLKITLVLVSLHKSWTYLHSGITESAIRRGWTCERTEEMKSSLIISRLEALERAESASLKQGLAETKQDVIWKTCES
jgi:hypothetical protein